MKNQILTNTYRSIKLNFPRFLSLVIMSFLGVFVFTGLQATSPSMLETLDSYLDESNVYDLKITSNVIINDETFKEIETAYIETLVYNDTLIEVSTITSTINQLTLLTGSIPTNDNDLAVEENFLKDNDLEIGDNIILNNKEYLIVGTVSSPIYFNNVSVNQERGDANYYAYISSKEDFNTVYVTIKNAKELTTGSDEYNTIINETLQNISESNVSTRDAFTTYNEYLDDTDSLNNLAKIFPLVFFIVAILISLVSMNRMVCDDRLEIGTLKSLGFKNQEIMLKYFLFSFFAVIIGSLLGCILGPLILPTIISSIYNILFSLPALTIVYSLKYSLLGIFISLICICGTTIITVFQVVKEKPANLMRHKAPQKGKRVFLEHLPFIWKRLKFSSKVTIRNLFRYQKRALVTILGVAGCLSLILCGFGLKDSISHITTKQYGEIFTFDSYIYVYNMRDKEIENTFKDYDYVRVQNISGSVNDTNVTLFITNKEDIKEIVNLKDLDGNPLELENDKVYITDKLAQLENLSVGDNINITINDEVITYTIGGIAENYINHYIYIASDKIQTTTLYFKENVDLENVISTSDQQEKVNNMLKSLNKVVIVLIGLASLLSFVVFYNLSNINISERKREIATLKVLGFHNHEVDNYITKENIILTIIGIIFGLIIGYFLTNVVISTVEIEKCRFIHEISIKSYLYSICLTILFTVIVDIITHFHLKKINMIDSLKSVE